jgi:hypothetical protein
MQWWTLVLGYRYWPKIQALQRPRPRNHQHRWPNPSIRRPLVSKPLANSGAETIRNRRGKDETEIHWSSWIHGKSWMTWWMTESDDIMLFLWPFWLIIMDVLMTMYTFFFTIVVDIYILVWLVIRSDDYSSELDTNDKPNNCVALNGIKWLCEFE